MRTVEGRGAGKLILVGEHAVVYGYPAVAFAVDRGTTLRVRPTDGPTSLRTPAPDPRIVDLLHDHFGTRSADISLSTTLPIGRGMGSSASLAVAIARASAAWNGTPATPDALWATAFDIERTFHGNPSGVDVACALRGGVLRYVKGPPPQTTSLPVPSWQLVVLDTGTAGDTAAQVAHVGSQRPGIDSLLARIGDLVDEAVEALDEPRALGLLMTEPDAILRQIGVSSPPLDRLVGMARATGAHGAKLSGAGGGGVVIALVDDPAPVLDAARAHRVEAFVVRPLQETPA